MLDIRLTDAFEAIKTLPDSSVDCILTDPPYNAAHYSTGNFTLPGRLAPVNNDIAAWDAIPFDPAAIFPDLLRVLKPAGNLFVFAGLNQVGMWVDLCNAHFGATNFAIWHKSNPTPCFQKTTFTKSCEIIITAWHKGHTWNFDDENPDRMHNFIAADDLVETSVCGGSERLKTATGETLHPTQKPLRVLRWLLDIGSHAGQTVLDPFMGVGSTGEAALMDGRHFIGFELNPSYFEAAQQRLSTTQVPLF